MLNTTSITGKLQNLAKPQPPQTTCCQALPLNPVQAPPHLLSTADAAFDLAVLHDMPRAGHSHTGRALCAVVDECCLLLWWNSPHTSKTTPPTDPLHNPAAAASAGPTPPGARCRGCILPCSAPWYAQGWPLTHWQGSVRYGCRVLPPPLEISPNWQTRTPNQHTAQPCRSPQRRFH